MLHGNALTNTVQCDSIYWEESFLVSICLYCKLFLFSVIDGRHFQCIFAFSKIHGCQNIGFQIRKSDKTAGWEIFQRNKLWAGNNPNLRRFTREKTWFDPFFLRSTENWTLKSHGDKRWKQFTNSFLEIKSSRVHARKNPTKLIYHHLTANPYRQITDTHKNGA